MIEFKQSALLALVRRYYPRGSAWNDHDHNPPPDLPEEIKRLAALWERELANDETWQRLKQTLRDCLSQGVGEMSVPVHDAGRRCAVYLDHFKDVPRGQPARIVVGAVSLIAPLYYVYGVNRTYDDPRNPDQLLVELPPGEMKEVGEVVARCIEQVYDYRPLPVELARVPVEGLCMDHMRFEGWTLLEALFTTDPANLP